MLKLWQLKLPFRFRCVTADRTNRLILIFLPPPELGYYMCSAQQ